MGGSEKTVGAIEWRDLTVNDAGGVSDFYAEVVGWHKQPISMGDYDDYVMNLASNGGSVAGICHARGSNSELPPQWLMYVRVENSKASAEKVVELGGEIIQGPRIMNGETYFVIRDPAGAVLAIYS
ncbi:MAG: VOC family protein [Arenicella sp.]|nr:VOC family protein [Arenicella sp.]